MQAVIKEIVQDHMMKICVRSGIECIELIVIAPIEQEMDPYKYTIG
jgi:hypothetical protein